MTTERHLFRQSPATAAPRCTCGELSQADVHCRGTAGYGHGLTARAVHNNCCSAAPPETTP